MEKEMVKIYSSLNRCIRLFYTLLHSFDLSALFEKISLSTQAKGELNSVILLNRPERQVVLTTFHEGTEIDSYQSGDSVTFQVIEGRMEFHAREESIILKEGQLFTFRKKINYSLTTVEETVFLLTILTGNRHRTKIKDCRV